MIFLLLLLLLLLFCCEWLHVPIVNEQIDTTSSGRRCCRNNLDLA
jgi:hypothetical protein